MAKSERYSWPYCPQWNYYQPHVLNLPKIAYNNEHGHHQVHPDPNENYLPIRCPEPRRPYQVPYPTYDSYCHQENYPIHGSFGQHNALYPKQYVHGPIPHGNANNYYKVSENNQSYPACSNFPGTKDQSNCYQTAWKNPSQCKKKTQELDVRKFLATWQEKDDDLLDISSETEESKASHNLETIPLDCTKRSDYEKNHKRNYESFVTGHMSSPAGCVVQPYYIKDNNISFSRNVIPSEEMNNNIPQRNNLNYGSMNHHGYYNKNYYSHSDYWKPTNSKMLSCEHSVSYPQQYNHCDINVNSLRNNIGYVRPKENLIEPSERSHYNLTSSLETGDLFCDINNRNDEHHKQQIVHPIFSDGHLRPLATDEPAYYGNYNNDFSENIVYSDLYPTKEPWEFFQANMKTKETVKNIEKLKPATKDSAHAQLNQHLANTNSSSGNHIMYEGAFNILPNTNDPNLAFNNSLINNTNGYLQAHNNECLKPASAHPLQPNKIIANVPKCPAGSGKIKPYNFNEEISSEDIDISIASSGGSAEEEHLGIGPTTVINFPRTKKEKASNQTTKVSEVDHNNKNSCEFSKGCLSQNSHRPPTITTESNELNLSTNKVSDIPVNKNSVTSSSEKNNLPLIKPIEASVTSPENAGDLQNLTPRNIEQVPLFIDKSNSNYLDITNDFYDKGIDKNHKSSKTSLEVEKIVLSPEGTDNSLNENSMDSETQKASSQIIKELNVLPNIVSENSPVEKRPDDEFITNDNLLLLAHCSQEYGSHISETKLVPKNISEGIPLENGKLVSPSPPKDELIIFGRVKKSSISISVNFDVENEKDLQINCKKSFPEEIDMCPMEDKNSKNLSLEVNCKSMADPDEFKSLLMESELVICRDKRDDFIIKKDGPKDHNLLEDELEVKKDDKCFLKDIISEKKEENCGILQKQEFDLLGENLCDKLSKECSAGLMNDELSNSLLDKEKPTVKNDNFHTPQSEQSDLSFQGQQEMAFTIDNLAESPWQSCVGRSLPIIVDSSEESNSSSIMNNFDLRSDESKTKKFSSDDGVKFEVDDSESYVFKNDIEAPHELSISMCSSEFGCKIVKDLSTEVSDCVAEKPKSLENHEKIIKPVRDTVIKCSLRWDKIFNVMSDEDSSQRDMSLDLGPAKVELRMPPENCSSGQWKIVEADNKIQPSSIVQVKRLILKRKNQSEERIPKMIIRKTEGKEYKSYLKNEPNESVLNCAKFKIICDIPSKPKSQKNDEISD